LIIVVFTMAAFRGGKGGGFVAAEEGSRCGNWVDDSPQGEVGGEGGGGLAFSAVCSTAPSEGTAPCYGGVFTAAGGTGGGRLGTLLTAASPGGGSFGPLTAQTDASSGRGVAVMLVLGPHEQTEPVDPGDLVGPELVGMAASSSDRGVNPSVSVPQEVQ